MNRFFVYEEYGAKYELMIKDVASAHRTMPQWEFYQKGLETLASSLGPVTSHSDKSRKALTIGDLLVKVVSILSAYGPELTICSLSNESANTHCFSPSYSSTPLSSTVRIRTWRLRALCCVSEKLPRKSTRPQMMRASERPWRRHGSFKTDSSFLTR
jgi:hypothetical protein